VYCTTPDDDVPVVSTATTCAASCLLGSAETVIVPAWPSWIFAASLSLKDAVTCRPFRPTSVMNADEELDALLVDVDAPPLDEVELDALEELALVPPLLTL
jgi:hypothetical protein